MRLANDSETVLADQTQLLFLTISANVILEVELVAALLTLILLHLTC